MQTASKTALGLFTIKQTVDLNGKLASRCGIVCLRYSGWLDSFNAKQKFCGCGFGTRAGLLTWMQCLFSIATTFLSTFCV